MDIRNGVPGGYTHVRGNRLQPLCNKLRIKYAAALVGWEGKKRYGFRPVLDGVVVSSRSAAKLRQAGFGFTRCPKKVKCECDDQPGPKN